MTFAAALMPCTRKRTEVNGQDPKTKRPSCPRRRGRAASVRVNSYNVEVQDEDGFLGDKASKGAFAGSSTSGASTEGGRRGPARRQPTDEISKKKPMQMLTEGEPEAAAMVRARSRSSRSSWRR